MPIVRRIMPNTSGPDRRGRGRQRRLPITVSVRDDPAEYQRQRRAYLRKLAAEQPELIPHGTRNAYDNWGCRCKRCSAEAVFLVRKSQARTRRTRGA